MEQQRLFSPHHFILADNPLPETMKVAEYYHNSEKEKECEEERSHVSTELTLSSEFQTQTNQLQTNKTSSFSTSTPTDELVNVIFSSQKEVSTALKLCDESWISKKRQEERHWGVSKTLRLCDQDPWKIKKKVTESDLGHLSRLLVRASLVKKHVLPFLGSDCGREVESKGIQVRVWDNDTKSKHHLVFKHWRTSKSYVFIGMWNQDFVIRRELKQGDEIGLYWDSNNFMFHFSVLQRARVKQRTISDSFSVSLGYSKKNYVCFN
jgi:hypothetical protein